MKKTNIHIGRLAVATALVAAMALPACKKYADPPPFFEDDSSGAVLNGRKVMLIVIDGGVSQALKTIAPPALTSMMEKGKYTYTARTEDVTTTGATWKTLASGVSYSRHNISDSSLVFSASSGSNQHDAPANYPSFMQFILTSSRADIKTSVISPWGFMVNKLFPEAEDPVVAANDQGVKDSALARLKAPDTDLMLVHFNGVNIAGKEHGYSASADGYKQAVLKVDGYIGELMAAMKARPEYNKSEEWMVIVTSSHGGNGNSHGGSSLDETNVFTLYYNENLKKQELIRGGFSGIQMTGRDATAIKAVLSNGNEYNPGTGQQTVQMRVRGTAGYYPHFFSKMERWPSTPGWSMFSAGGNWAISVRTTTSGERRIQPGSPTIFNNQWHTITLVFADSANKKWVRRYTDGVRHDHTDITSLFDGGGTLTTTAPITIGWGSDPTYTGVTFFPADLMIFNTALTDAEIASNICLKDVTTHPKYTNLIGYWPGTDGYGSQFVNKAPGQSTNFVLSGPYKWAGLTDVPCSLNPLGSGEIAVQPANVDIVAQMFYWMRISVNSSWNLDGSGWINLFERELVQL
ncbi:MAG: alkaline phosphatase family protein [Chitinophagaceae bacterium]